jgi:integrase
MSKVPLSPSATEENLWRFFHDVFVTEWLQVCNRGVLQKYMQAIDWLFIWLTRQPTFDDITEPKLQKFCAWLVETRRAAAKGPHANSPDTAKNYASRLRQIRRYAGTKSTQCGRDMRLIDFLMKVYLQERILKNWSVRTYRKHVTSLSKFYGSDIMLSELNGPVLLAWVDHLKRDAVKAHEGIVSMWRLAFELGYVTTEPETKDLQGTPAPVETNGDSLRLLMTAKYFPAKWSIQAEYLGHEPTIADLLDDNVAGMMRMLQKKGLATRTINERRGRITALWKWLASRGYLSTFPTIDRIPEQQSSPEAWTKEELHQLFQACRDAPGKIGDLPAADWWLGLHMILWETGERIGAVLDIEWAWIEPKTLQLHIPAASRKGRKKEAFYTLTRETIQALDRLRSESNLVFPFPATRASFFNRYKTLLKRAGLPRGRKDMAHKMRRSVSSHLFANGQDDTKALGHSDAYTTQRSYRDPRICRSEPLGLFKPWQDDSES